MIKHITILSNLVKEFGYWSKEVCQYNSNIIGKVSYKNYQIIQSEIKNI